MTTSRSPFRDDLAAALERADRFARENARLRTKLSRRRLHWIQWVLVSLIGLSVAGIGYLVVATG
jgi:membrane protein required for beta-lactamase induction